jgi:hypothetical protein
MAKRKARAGVKKAKAGRKPAPSRRSAKRPKAVKRKAPAAARARKATGRAKTGGRKTTTVKKATVKKAPRLDRARKTLPDNVPTPPSSLNMHRRGSAVRSGRAELAESRQVHGAMSRSITAGDVDVNLEQAYFSGDEAPGGDNPTPDQDIVDDIGKAIGVEYQDNEELKASDKVTERDKHRWELDPASSEDYKDRK